MSESNQEYSFFGRVFPEHLPAGIGNIVSEVESPFYSFTLEWLVQQNHIVAVANTEEKVENIFTLRNIVQSRIEPMIDALSFLTGRPYIVTLEYVSFPDGTSRTLSPGARIITEFYDSENQEQLAQLLFDAMNTVGGDYLELALSDFAQSLFTPEETPFHCQRALESIRHYFSQEFGIEDSDDLEKWDKMWEELDYDNGQIMTTIVPKARDRRHGRAINVDSDERKVMFQETWIVIRKFAEYLTDKYDPDSPDIKVGP